MKRGRNAGIALFDLVLSLTLLTVISGSSISLLFQLTKLSQGTTSQQQSARELRRMAATFRDLVHEADRVAVGEPANSITIHLTDESISTWTQTNDGVEYQTTGTTSRFDRFKIGTASAVEFAWDETEAMVSLKVIGNRARGQEVQIDAALPFKEPAPAAGAEK